MASNRIYLCGICRNPGHNRRTCLIPEGMDPSAKSGLLNWIMHEKIVGAIDNIISKLGLRGGRTIGNDRRGDLWIHEDDYDQFIERLDKILENSDE